MFIPTFGLFSRNALLMNDHIMAQSNFDDIQLDSLTVCPVCFQKFNIPRILPCSHTFCHDCLDGHIKSSTKSKPLDSHVLCVENL